MKQYACRHPRSVGTNSVYCDGKMTRTVTDHKGIERYVCSKCKRVAYWWDEPFTVVRSELATLAS